MSNSKIMKKPIRMGSYETLLGLNSNEENTSGHSVQRLYPIKEISFEKLKEFPMHPFKVEDDKKMEELVDSIQRYGLFHPGIAIQDPTGGYFIVSGHRRARAMMLAGKGSMPFRIIETDMDTARIIMVDSNFQQRDELLPSEKAKAYRQKFDAIRRQGRRGEGSSFDEIGEAAGESGRTVQRFIRISYLIDELLELIDQKKLGIVQGYNLSYLSETNQRTVYEAILEAGVNISKKQSAKIKESAERGNLLLEMVMFIISDKKKKVDKCVSLKKDTLSRFFTDDMSEDEMERIILDLLEEWKRRS